MPNHPDPPSLTLARAIRDLLVDSGAMMSDKTAALDIAQRVINAEYAEEVLGPMATAPYRSWPRGPWLSRIVV